jgi:glyoxylase-like metal-dependent hydrolase (beta-lactamase superfamily II)
MIEEMLPGIFRIPVPLPRNPLKEINSYVLTSKDRNLIIDTGMNRPACIKVYDEAMKELAIDLSRTDFIATHLHADHQGLIPLLMKPGSRAYMGEPDAAPMMQGTTAHARKMPMGDYAALNGFPEDELKEAQENHPGFKYGPQAPIQYIYLKEGDVFNVGEYTLEAIATPGHTHGHMCLLDRKKKLFFSGDHVLGDITPNINAWSDDEDPLEEYITSLKKIDAMDITLCLPGHRTVITDIRKRIAELIEHHRVRANEVIDILTGKSMTGYDVAAHMTWDIVAKSWADFPVMQKWFATGEALAHIRYLVERGLIQKELKNNILYYSTDGKNRL